MNQAKNNNRTKHRSPLASALRTVM